MVPSRSTTLSFGSAAFLARDPTGIFFDGNAKSFPYPFPLFAEVKAVLITVNWVLDSSAKKIVIELDCYRIIEWVSSIALIRSLLRLTKLYLRFGALTKLHYPLLEGMVTRQLIVAIFSIPKEFVCILEDFPSQSKKLIEACEEWGCFRLINHSIPTTLMSEMKSAVRLLLDLPIEIKQRNTEVIAGSGYVGPSKVNPLYEGLGLYDIGSPDAVRAFCDQLDSSPQLRETVVKYSQAVHQLAMDIGRKLAKSMGLVDDLFNGWPCQFRINKYHFTPESVGSSGVQIHTDSGFLTILQDDENVGGLEVMDKNSGEFIAVDPMPNTLLVNLGDIGTVWSNGRFYNVKHRVQCKEATIRVSIALFVLGPKVETVEAPTELVDSEHPRLYVPFTFEDFRKLRLSTGMRAGEALSLLHTNKP